MSLCVVSFLFTLPTMVSMNVLKVYLSLYTLLRSHLFVNCCIRRYSLYTKVILARPSRRSPTGTSTSGTSGSRWVFAHSAAWKNSETDLMVNFSHASSYRGGNYNCLLSHIARWFPIANNLQEFFVHAVLFPNYWPRRSSQNFHFWLKVLISNFFFDTSLHHSFQSVIIRS